jgi:hypothetical protein
MLSSLKIKGAAIAVSVALLGGTAWLAAGSTGAYFSDTHTGTISGTVGSIRRIRSDCDGPGLLEPAAGCAADRDRELPEHGSQR